MLVVRCRNGDFLVDRAVTRGKVLNSSVISSHSTAHPPPSVAREGAAHPRFGLASGQLVAWLLLAVVSAGVVYRDHPGDLPWRVHATVYLYVVGQLLAVGLLVSALVDGWRRLKWRWLDYPVIALASAAIGWWMLPEDLQGVVGRLPQTVPSSAWNVLLVLAAGAGVAAAAWVGRLLARSYVRWLGVLFGLALAGANHFVATHDYPGIHFFVAFAAATFIGAVLVARPAPAHRRGSALGHGTRLLLAVPAAFVLIVAPSNSVGVQLYRGAQAVVAPWATRLRRFIPLKAPPQAYGARNSRWFVSRANAPAQAPSGLAVLPEHPVVILFVTDAMRADLLDPKYENQLPNFHRLAGEGVRFLAARTPAPCTNQAVTSIFTSRYYSQIFWEKEELSVHCFPYRDESVRFTDVLVENGVQTVSRTGFPFLANEFGTLSGFQDQETVKRVGRRYATSERIIPEVNERLLQIKPDQSVFFYIHVDDPHNPYTLGKGGKTRFEKYASEVAVVDEQLGTMLDTLEKTGLAERTMLILTADHGEAFGEHGQYYHATSVYEELLRIPLVFHFPGAKAASVHEPVSLVDLGPTILDVFGQVTPGTFMGQSLVPFLAGRPVKLDRPIVADSPRLMRAMVFGDGRKLITNTRTHVYELYDLNQDPDEKHNIYDDDPEAPLYTQLMRDFFDAHELQRDGYEIKFCR